METTRNESWEQVNPHMKWVRRGREQGSEVEEKSQLSRQEDGRIEEAFTAALKALRAEMSEERVRQWAVERERRREKMSKWDLSMVMIDGKAWEY